tara:strand:+ start:316 stop:609 length:294 start_codon:yes stop_codon:yes gene_type:complete
MSRVGTQCKTHHEISVGGKRSVVINEILEEDVDGEWLWYFQVIECEANRWYSAETLNEAKCRAADLALGLGVSRGRYPFKLGEDLEQWEIEIWGKES